jgi:hypothetical protein
MPQPRFGVSPLVATLLAVVATALVPSVAAAKTTVSLSGNTLVIVGDDAPSALAHESSYAGFQLRDTAGGEVSSGPGCAPIDLSAVACGAFPLGDPYGANYSITATLGGGDDTYKYAIFDGPQTVDGQGGDDTIETGGGKDTVNGGPGNDDLTGGRGDDTLDGGDGDDKVDGWDGSDSVTGGAGRDILLGDGGTLYSGGNDTLFARDGEADSLDCGGGADRAVIDAGGDTVNACATIDRPVAAGGGGGGGGTPVAALSVTGAVAKKQTPSALSKGKKLKVTLTSNATCSGVVAIGISKGEAKRLKLGKKIMSIGTGEATTVTAGAPTTLTVAVASKYRSKLKNASKLKATIVIACVDAAQRTFTGGLGVTLKK